MVYLFMESGRRVMPEIKAVYATVEEAQEQAAHNLARDYQRPIRIEDEKGEILKDYQ